MSAHRIPTAVIRSLWLIGVPLVAIAVYLAIGVGIVSALGEPILGTIVTSGVVVAAIGGARLLNPGWFRYAPAPAPAGRTPRFWRGTLLCVGLAFLAGQSLALWLYVVAGSEGFDQSIRTRAAAGLDLTLVLVLLAAPMAEELLFRGLVYPVLRRRVGVIGSVITTTVAFGVMHGNAVQFAAALPLAVLLALVYERTRTLWPAMTIHLLFNLAAMFVPASFLAGLANPFSALLLTTAFGTAIMLLYRRNALGEDVAEGPAGDETLAA